MSMLQQAANHGSRHVTAADKGDVHEKINNF